MGAPCSRHLADLQKCQKQCRLDFKTAGYGFTLCATSGHACELCMSRRLIQKANPSRPDIKDRDSRLIGQKARVVQAFEGGRGRVFVSGAEWPAQMEDAAPDLGQDVVVTAVDGSLLTVRGAG